MAWFSGIFFFSYAWARCLPAVGPLRPVDAWPTLYILTWSLFTALIGVAEGVVMLLAMRLGCGLGQAGAYPAAGSLLSKWVPLASRGIASSLVVLGGRLGAVIAPFLTGMLIVSFTPLSTPVDLEARNAAQAGKAGLPPLRRPETPALSPTPREPRLARCCPEDGQSL